MDAASRCPAREPGAADGWPDARPRTSRRGPEGATAYAAQPPEVPAQAYRARPRGLPSAAIPDRPTAYSYQPVRRTRLDPRCRPAQWRPARVRHRGTAGRVLLARPGGRAATTGTVDEPRGGFVSILKLPGGRYAWRHREGARHLKKTFARRADAAAWDARVRADVARGTHVDLSSQVTVAEYARAWSAARVLRPGTRRIHDVFLRHHVEGAWGGGPIVRVRPSEIQAWVASRSAILAPGTLRNYLGMLRSVFAAAALDGVIARNPVLPAGRLSLPRRERPKIMPLTVAQVQAWADAAPPRIRNMIVAQGCPRPADQRTAGAAAGRCGLPTARGPGGGPAGPGWPTPSATQVSERGPDRAAAHRGLRSAGRP